MGTSHSVVTALQSVLRQCGLKIANKTLEGFVKEIDRIAPWYACSGSLTITFWEKLKGDLVREQQYGNLKAGTMPFWELVRSCLKDEECQQMVKVGQRILEEIQDSLSEAEQGERLGVRRKHGAPKKKTSLSTDLEPEEERFRESMPWESLGKGMERESQREIKLGRHLREGASIRH
jgi:protein O-GlcNAc transferase